MVRYLTESECSDFRSGTERVKRGEADIRNTSIFFGKVFFLRSGFTKEKSFFTQICMMVV